MTRTLTKPNVNVNGRSFCGYGFKFYVQNIVGRKKGGYKYVLCTIDGNGRYNLVYDIVACAVPKFYTVKEARWWVRFLSGKGKFIKR